MLGKGQSVKLQENDFVMLQNLLKVSLTDASSGQKMGYLKFIVNSSMITRTDLKQLSGGAFLNKPVTLEVFTSEQPETEQPEEPTEEPTPKEEPQAKPTEVPEVEPELTDKEIKEIVNESIKKFFGEIR